MHLPQHQLATLVAVADHGTFEAAAVALSITPSAVSQRIRALETAVGQVLVQRSSPASPTESGQVLVRLGREQALLQSEAEAALGASPESVIELRVAVNADSLAGWFLDVLTDVAAAPRTALRVTVQDQAYSASLLRNGEVVAAVTSDPNPIRGCRVTPLGSMRYRPVAAASLLERTGALADPTSLPMLIFDDQDALQHDLLERIGQQAPSVVHRVPTSEDFRRAVVAGIGWGMLPDYQMSDAVHALSDDTLDVPLYWQCWRLASSTLDELSDAVIRRATAALRQPDTTTPPIPGTR